jgi:hypothetical protein
LSRSSKNTSRERFEAAYRRQAQNPQYSRDGGGGYITEVVLYPIGGEIVLLDAKAASDEVAAA